MEKWASDVLTPDDIDNIINYIKQHTAEDSMARYYADRQHRQLKSHMKNLKKHYIIREYDFSKLPAELKKSYDISFKPLDRAYFEKRTTFFYMKGKKYLGDQYALSEYPNHLLKRLTNITLWDRNYPEWLIKYDDQNQLQIRAGLRQPESKLGLVTFKPKQKETEQ